MCLFTLFSLQYMYLFYTKKKPKEEEWMSLARRTAIVDRPIFNISCSCMLTLIAGLSAFCQQINAKNSHKNHNKNNTNRKNDSIDDKYNCVITTTNWNVTHSTKCFENLKYCIIFFVWAMQCCTESDTLSANSITMFINGELKLKRQISYIQIND